MNPGKLFYPFTVLAILLSLSACGGGGSETDPEPEPEVACIIGSSTIGDCTL